LQSRVMKRTNTFSDQEIIILNYEMQSQILLFKIANMSSSAIYLFSQAFLSQQQRFYRKIQGRTHLWVCFSWYLIRYTLIQLTGITFCLIKPTNYMLYSWSLCWVTLDALHPYLSAYSYLFQVYVPLWFLQSIPPDIKYL
jgi:hypothetical protein